MLRDLHKARTYKEGMIGLVRIPAALTRRKLWIFTIIIVASLVVSVYAYEYTSLGRPRGHAPLFTGDQEIKAPPILPSASCPQGK